MKSDAISGLSMREISSISQKEETGLHIHFDPICHPTKFPGDRNGADGVGNELRKLARQHRMTFSHGSHALPQTLGPRLMVHFYAGANSGVAQQVQTVRGERVADPNEQHLDVVLGHMVSDEIREAVHAPDGKCPDMLVVPETALPDDERAELKGKLTLVEPLGVPTNLTDNDVPDPDNVNEQTLAASEKKYLDEGSETLPSDLTKKDIVFLPPGDAPDETGQKLSFTPDAKNISSRLLSHFAPEEGGRILVFPWARTKADDVKTVLGELQNHPAATVAEFPFQPGKESSLLPLLKKLRDAGENGPKVAVGMESTSQITALARFTDDLTIMDTTSANPSHRKFAEAMRLSGKASVLTLDGEFKPAARTVERERLPPTEETAKAIFDKVLELQKNRPEVATVGQ